MPAFTAMSDVVSPDEVRALLGVTKKELSDATVALGIYFLTLKSNINWYSSSLIPAYEAITTPSTADEQRFCDSFKTFGGWMAAKVYATSMPQFSPRSITDGKAAFQRQLASPNDTLKNIEEQLAAVYQQLADAYTALNPVSPGVVIGFKVGRATPGSFDPITG